MLDPGVKVTHRHGSSEADDSMLGGRVDRCARQWINACRYRRNNILSLDGGRERKLPMIILFIAVIKMMNW